MEMEPSDMMLPERDDPDSETADCALHMPMLRSPCCVQYQTLVGHLLSPEWCRHGYAHVPVHAQTVES